MQARIISGFSVTGRALTGPRQLRQTFRQMALAYGGDNLRLRVDRPGPWRPRQVCIFAPNAAAIIRADA